MNSRIKKILDGIIGSDRVVGAYIFSGPPGVGKREAAKEFAKLLGSKKQDQIFIEPDGATLKIGQVRELQSWVRFGPSASKYLIVVVSGADTLTGEAAAAFLKTLEEPAKGVVFVLLVERDDRLPATIHSRCQRIIFPEKTVKWEADPELKLFYKELEAINHQNVFRFSGILEKEKERIEDLLYNLVYYSRYQLKNVKFARIILDGLRYIKRRSNLKLTLDVICLRLANG